LVVILLWIRPHMNNLITNYIEYIKNRQSCEKKHEKLLVTIQGMVNKVELSIARMDEKQTDRFNKIWDKLEDHEKRITVIQWQTQQLESKSLHQ
jgi:division protein CdvB (Snf7/Vps24/ESCRT-III family)